MELSTDNLFAFVYRRYKQKENKTKQITIFKIGRRQISKNKEEKKENKSDIVKYFHALIINNSNISNVLYNSIDPFVKECFSNLKYLSITNNYIRSLDFLLYLPNLYFLDIHGNPLEDLDALNHKNIFGYLGLSVEVYNEKKILSIYDLKCGILEIDLKDKNTLRLFSVNNHHICMVNNDVNYIIDKIKYEEIKIKLMKKKGRKEQRQTDLSVASFNDATSDMNNAEVKKDVSMSQLIKNLQPNKQEITKNAIPEKPIVNVVITDESLLKIKDYFDGYQKIINRTLNIHIDTKNRIKSYVQNSEIFSSKNLAENQPYLQHEKDKLLMLFDIYKKISVFNKDKVGNKFYVGNIYYINVNQNLDDIFVKEIKNNIMNHSQSPRASIIILISIIFYTIGTISEKMMNALINYILTKYYKHDENKGYLDFSKFGNVHYLSFYYSTFDYIYKRMVDNEKNININQYKEILNILQMKKLILKSNYLYKKLKENKTKDNNVEFCQNRKNRIINEIKSLKDLDITKECLVLIEFLCDYIIYEKIEEVVINKSYPGEYSYFIELKETIEENEFQVNNENFLSTLSLSAFKFQKDKKERIFNKFYFEKDKIKQIKNKEFKNYITNEFNNKSRTMNNFNSSIVSSNIINSNFNNNKNNMIYFNDDENENKNDDIMVDEFFYIDSKAKNQSKRNLNNNSSVYNSKEKENFYDNSYDENRFNDSSLKLPSLFQNQQKSYEEFEFLKQMIFNPEFLSQHARNVIKFEKLAKKIQKNQLKFRNNMHINISESKLGKLNKGQSNEFLGSPCATIGNFNNGNNISKINSNVDSNVNENSSIVNNSSKALFKPGKEMNLKKNKTPNKFKLNIKTISEKEKQYRMKKMNERNNKTSQNFERSNHFMRNIYHKPFFEVPESFPGITLLNFGLKTSKRNPRNLKALSKKNSSNNDLKEEEKKPKSHKQQIITKIKQTVRDNITRNCRRVVCPIQYYS